MWASLEFHMFPLIVAAVAAFGVTKGAADGTLFSGGSDESAPATSASDPTPAPADANAQPKEQTVNEAVKKG